MESWAYVGIGYAAEQNNHSSDSIARFGRGFAEIQGTIRKLTSRERTSTTTYHYPSSVYTFGGVSEDKANTNYKYLRIGLWWEFYVCDTNGNPVVDNCSCEMALQINFKVSRSSSNGGPTFNISNGSTINSPVIISDSDGIKNYTLQEVGGSSITRTITGLSSTSVTNSCMALATQNGKQYNLTATDIWGNSSTISFMYFIEIFKDWRRNILRSICLGLIRILQILCG